MDEKEREAAWWLGEAPGWGAVKLRQLTGLWGMPARVREIVGPAGQGTGSRRVSVLYEELLASAERSELKERIAITEGDMERLVQHGKREELCRDRQRRWQEAGVRFVTVWDAAYPRRLLPLYDRPFALYVRGRLPQEDRPTAAVIGARACSGYGSSQGQRFAMELAAAGVQIVSGLAEGVDSEGHWGALKTGLPGATYAVFGCGVDRCYPREHEKLAGRILENGGGLLSEFPPGTAPCARNFPIRNRIISGLSDCILVMEARKRSGSLITVDQALEQGKEVFALPGRVGDRLSEGCHQLIQNGAALLTDSGEVLEFLSSGRFAHSSSRASEEYAGEASASSDRHMGQVYPFLDYQGRTVRELAELTGLTPAQVHAELLPHLIGGRILEKAKGCYVRNPG